MFRANKYSYLKSYATLTVYATLFVCGSCSPQCRDDRGDSVDWFYMYKLPRQENHLNPLIRGGVAYVYLTPSTLKNGWVMSDLTVSNPLSMLGRTLAPLYKDSNIVSVVYNDQPPIPPPEAWKTETLREQASKRFEESGHTKGVVLGDNSTGVWLVHSVPKFPPVPDVNSPNSTSYDYPHTGTKYGQALLCMTVPTSTLNQIGMQLKYNEPLVVYSHIPQEFEQEVPNLVDVVYNRTIDAAPWYHTQTFSTLSGHKFLSFAKCGRFHDDLYSGLVAEQLRSDLLVETWTNGPGPLDSECSRTYQVRNIEQLKFLTAKMSFTSHHDHSKWAVGVDRRLFNSKHTNGTQYWVCVGDINRALSQESRGGGTVCTSTPILWVHFAGLVDTAQTCNTTAH